MPIELLGYIAVRFKTDRRGNAYAEVVLYTFEGEAQSVWPHWHSFEDLYRLSKHYTRIPECYVDEPISRLRTEKLRIL